MNHQHDMAKIQIKSEKLTPFGGIFPIMEYFNSKLSPVIDRVLGLRCKQFGYQYSEIIRSLMCVYLCGGSCIEDFSSHLLRHLSLHPTLHMQLRYGAPHHERTQGGQCHLYIGNGQELRFQHGGRAQRPACQ